MCSLTNECVVLLERLFIGTGGQRMASIMPSNMDSGESESICVLIRQWNSPEHASSHYSLNVFS